MFNTDNLNASRVVVMVHRFEVMYRIQVSLVIRRSGYDKLWAELYRWNHETIPMFAFIKLLLKEEKFPQKVGHCQCVIMGKGLMSPAVTL